MKYYMPNTIQKWNQINVTQCGNEFPVKPTNGMGDFWIPVFKSREECLEHYPNNKVTEIQDVV